VSTGDPGAVVTVVVELRRAPGGRLQAHVRTADGRGDYGTVMLSELSLLLEAVSADEQGQG
jgi:hypothetical protein